MSLYAAASPGGRVLTEDGATGTFIDQAEVRGPRLQQGSAAVLFLGGSRMPDQGRH